MRVSPLTGNANMMVIPQAAPLNLNNMFPQKWSLIFTVRCVSDDHLVRIPYEEVDDLSKDAPHFNERGK